MDRERLFLECHPGNPRTRGPVQPRYVSGPMPIPARGGQPVQDAWSTMSSGTMPLRSMPTAGPGAPGGAPAGAPAGVMTEEYLEPTPPRPTPTPDHHRRVGYKPRTLNEHDSGVADVDGLHLSVDSNMNGLGPRSSGEAPLLQPIGNRERMRRPDSLAVKGHEYEELPASRYQAGYQYPEVEESGSGSGVGGRPLPPPLLTKLKSMPSMPNADSNENLVRPVSGTSSNGGVPGDRLANMYRKRENPLYDDGDPDDLEVKSMRSRGILACPCSGLLLVGLMAVVALILALYVTVGQLRARQDMTLSPDQFNHSELLTAFKNMRQLEQKYNRLLEKYTVLEAVVGERLAGNGTVTALLTDHTATIARLTANGSHALSTLSLLTDKVESINKIDGKQNESLSQVNSKVEFLQTKFNQLNASVKQGMDSLRQDSGTVTSRLTLIDRDVDRLQTDLQRQLDDVRKMPGPAGAPGAGNLSQCEYFFKRSGGSADVGSTVTDLWPSTDDDIQRWVIMGVECSTTGGTAGLLRPRIHPNHPSVTQFQCECLGRQGSQASRFCRLNVWRCPKLS